MPTSAEGIKKAYRTQAKQWHPDNFTLYEQQIEAGHYFIRAKEAYDLLLTLNIADLNNYKPQDESDLIKRDRASERPYTTEHRIFKTPLFKEADNILSLFYLFAKWDLLGLPTIFSKAYNSVNQYIHPQKQGYGPTTARFILFSLIIVFSTVLAALVVPILVFVAIMFAPLMWFYIKSVKALTVIFKRTLGYLPAPNCGNLGGELLYLCLRSLFPVILLIAGILFIPFTDMRYSSLLLFSGYLAFTAFINISVLYEWVSFYRVQYLRSKIKNSYTP
jgi:hypothetical protein